MASFGLNGSRCDAMLNFFIRGALTRRRVEISTLPEKNKLPTSECPRRSATEELSRCHNCDNLKRVAFGASSLSQPWRPKVGKQRVMQTVRTNSFLSSNALTTP